ncbi:DnaJ domain-containing protein [Candidatus Poribacteria bacterium]|nr:DnaJ domain-containing protein [Candidatus Poribacteria bacterium]
MTRGEALEILGLDSDASLDDARKAYLTLVKIYHPDKNHASNASVIFRMIRDAWQFVQNVSGQEQSAPETEERAEEKHAKCWDNHFELAIGWGRYFDYKESKQYWNPSSHWGDRFFYFQKSNRPEFQVGQKIQIDTGDVLIERITRPIKDFLPHSVKTRFRTSDNRYYTLGDIEEQLIRNTEWVTTAKAIYRCPQHGILHRKVFYTIDPPDTDKDIRYKCQSDKSDTESYPLHIQKDVWYKPSCTGQSEQFSKSQMYLFGTDHHFRHVRNILGKIEEHSKRLSMNWFTVEWDTYTIRLSSEWYEPVWLDARRGANDWGYLSCDKAFAYNEVQMVKVKMTTSKNTHKKTEDMLRHLERFRKTYSRWAANANLVSEVYDYPDCEECRTQMHQKFNKAKVQYKDELSQMEKKASDRLQQQQ